MSCVNRVNARRAFAAFVDRINAALTSLLATTAIVVVAASLLPTTALAQSGPPATSSLIVKFAAGLSAEDAATVVARNGGVERSSVPALRLHVI